MTFGFSPLAFKMGPNVWRNVCQPIRLVSPICFAADSEREVAEVSDLTFGEYVWLLEEPKHWERLALPLDRKTFIDQVKKVRDIRNDVVHFDPDPLGDELKILRDLVRSCKG